MLYWIIGVILMAGVCVTIGVVIDNRLNRKRRQRYLDNVAAYNYETKRWIDNHEKLSPIDTDIILKRGENAYYSSPAILYETRPTRHYAGSGGRIHVGNGMSVSAGGGHGYSTDDLTQISSGVLIITNRRVVFDGGTQDRCISLSKILSASDAYQQLEISCEGRQKSMVFVVDNAAIPKIIIESLAKSAR